MEITKERILKSKLIKGTDMGDGRLEYYYQDHKGKAFYLWDINGLFTVDLMLSGYQHEVSIELETWEELESLFYMVTRVEL